VHAISIPCLHVRAFQAAPGDVSAGGACAARGLASTSTPARRRGIAKTSVRPISFSRSVPPPPPLSLSLSPSRSLSPSPSPSLPLSLFPYPSLVLSLCRSEVDPDITPRRCQVAFGTTQGGASSIGGCGTRRRRWLSRHAPARRAPKIRNFLNPSIYRLTSKRQDGSRTLLCSRVSGRGRGLTGPPRCRCLHRYFSWTPHSVMKNRYVFSRLDGCGQPTA